VTQPTGAPPVRVARVRPALVFPEDQANQLLREAEEQDVTAGGTFSAGPAGVQVWSEPLVGLPIDGVRANLHEPPVTDPFRAASGTG
jgi:hypothetical protein